MKNFLISLLFCTASMTIIAENDSEQMLAAAQTGDLTTLQNIFSKNDAPESLAIDRAFLAAYDAQQPKDVQLFLLSKSTTKGSLWANACTRGPVELVKILLEDDAKTDIRNTVIGHKHILDAKNAGQIEIAKTLQVYLVAKGYAYAGTIELDQK
jgi:hypothetical protein